MTVNRLGVTGALGAAVSAAATRRSSGCTAHGTTRTVLKTVESTNPVESMIEIVRHHAPPSEALAARRDGAALDRRGDAGRQDQFRRVRGFRQLPALIAALAEVVVDQPRAAVPRHVPADATA